jgi:hypothetical protein
MTAEERRLAAAHARQENWQRWGPYLSERQWGTVREDYSPDGRAWESFPHEHAASRAYRWGEDGLLGITDRECRLCFAVALWNGRDPILKERLFGLTGPQGNHGEDVKECYYYLDATPAYTYMKALYKYPQAEYPYARLVEESRRRGKQAPEFELAETGIFDEDRYFDVFAEYAKATPDDLCIRLTVHNRGPEDATLHVLPTLWFRNTWSWGCKHEGCWMRPSLHRADPTHCVARHETLGEYRLEAGPAGRVQPELLFTNNETNVSKLYGAENASQFVRDAFHECVVHGRREAVNPHGRGTRMAAWYQLTIPAGGSVVIPLRFASTADMPMQPFGKDFDKTFVQRLAEADEFYATRLPSGAGEAESAILRQAYAGLLWSKQFFHYVVGDWLEGDPGMPKPPDSRLTGRNATWTHLFNRDLLSVPDKWEYPWFAAWDLAFHMLPMSDLDLEFAKHQLLLFLREWYLHPNGQIPAYEWNLCDVNPPVHAWACRHVYDASVRAGQPDRAFLARAFHKLLINFTWWVNRKDPDGKNLFSGGFLGLDNIGVFDRSQPAPSGGHLEQADGTAWMAFYCASMLDIAMELADEDPTYEDVASKFFEHFVAIADASNHIGGKGLWDEEDGFYYDRILMNGQTIPLKVRSLVGLIPLLAVDVLDHDTIERLPGFRKRMTWFLENRKDLAESITYLPMLQSEDHSHAHRLLALPCRPRLERMLEYLFDENEFLSPYGIRSLSRVHLDHPYVFHTPDGQQHVVRYSPAESDSYLFGGNSNWRGPVWFPINCLIIEALDRYHHFYGDTFQVECPTGSGHKMNLGQAADEIARRLSALFLPDAEGRRPCFGIEDRYARDPHWRDLLLFHEYFDGDTGRGVGASHQTGWTALITRTLARCPRPQ